MSSQLVAPSRRPHGSYARYKLDNCRCYPCAAACSEYRYNRERALAYGTWQPFVPAEPVRTHVLHLRACGIGVRRLVVLAEVSRSCLRDLMNGKPGRPPSSRIRPGAAARILAVEATLDNIAGHTPVDPSGTRRRVQALVTVGWSQAQLADRLGMTRTNFGQMLARSQVTAAKARAVRALFDQLWDIDPATAANQASITRARRYATARGWLPPAAWDDDLIDLPEAELEAEIARRAAAMSDAEARACHTARYKHGDRSPLTVAGALENNRRMKRRRRAEPAA